MLYCTLMRRRHVSSRNCTVNRRLSSGPGGRCRGTTPLPHFRPRALPLTAPHPSKSLRNIEQVSYKAAPANKDTAEADLPHYTLKTLVVRRGLAQQARAPRTTDKAYFQQGIAFLCRHHDPRQVTNERARIRPRSPFGRRRHRAPQSA